MTSALVCPPFTLTTQVIFLKPRKMRNFNCSEATDDPPLVAE